jgi:hypothetical protein
MIPESTQSYIEHQWNGYKKAKEMEKEQMIDFAEQVFRNRYNEVYQSLTKIATDTFNETYGGNK